MAWVLRLATLSGYGVRVRRPGLRRTDWSRRTAGFAALFLAGGFLGLNANPEWDEGVIDAVLMAAGENRSEIEGFLDRVPEGLRDSGLWLLEHMPREDLEVLGAAFLLEHLEEADRAWRTAPWHESTPREIFYDAILPYASASETRELWRKPLRAVAEPIVAGIDCPAEAAVRLNKKFFERTGVRYSTERRRADQSPSESIDSGLASCTGLSILLINACRSVGIPARFVGVPSWSDDSGNHSWVEVWDGERWRFTGAAEPTGDALDEAWFTGRTASAVPGDPRYGIYAVTWRSSGQRFPVSFRRGRPSPSRAIDVTRRYLQSALEIPEGYARLRVVVRQNEIRKRTLVSIRDTRGGIVFEGMSRDERADANDHLEAVLPVGETYVIFSGETSRRTILQPDERLIELQLGANARSPDAGEDEPLILLERHLDAHGLYEVKSASFADTPLSKEQARRAAEMLWEAQVRQTRETRSEIFPSGELEYEGYRMPFWYTVYGERPPEGRSLYVSLHGGGGTHPSVNDRQWENQKRLYQPEEGVYLAPRAPTDTWNLWHQPHIDALFDRLLADLFVFGDVNPDRVYLMGYSAGGDGVYQLASRMSDRFAAAAMMAGHPNDARMEGLRNIPFTLHMGAEDSAYDRNRVAREWKRRLAELRKADPGGYPHWVEIYEGKGHWMNGADAAAVPWMATYERDLSPDRIVWVQHAVPHQRYYWLLVENPRLGAEMVVERQGQVIEIETWERQGELAIRLDDTMLNLDEPVLVRHQTQELFRGDVSRTIAVLARTLMEREDPRGMFPVEIRLRP